MCSGIKTKGANSLRMGRAFRGRRRCRSRTRNNCGTCSDCPVSLISVDFHTLHVSFEPEVGQLSLYFLSRLMFSPNMKSELSVFGPLSAEYRVSGVADTPCVSLLKYVRQYHFDWPCFPDFFFYRSALQVWCFLLGIDFPALLDSDLCRGRVSPRGSHTIHALEPSFILNEINIASYIALVRFLLSCSSGHDFFPIRKTVVNLPSGGSGSSASELELSAINMSFNPSADNTD